jgi:hypothetical protein
MGNIKGLEAEKILYAFFLNVEKAAKKQSTKTMRNSIRHSIVTPSNRQEIVRFVSRHPLRGRPV